MIRSVGDSPRFMWSYWRASWPSFACETTEMSVERLAVWSLFFHRLLTKKITQLSKLSTFECILGNSNLYLERCLMTRTEDSQLICLWTGCQYCKIIIKIKETVRWLQYDNGRKVWIYGSCYHQKVEEREVNLHKNPHRFQKMIYTENKMWFNWVILGEGVCTLCSPLYVLKKLHWVFIVRLDSLVLIVPSPFLSLSPHSGGGGRVGHDAGTDTWPLAGGGLPAQPGPAGGHLGHHAHWSTQAGRLPPAGHHAVPATFPGEAGEEAAGHQDRGEEGRGETRR